MRCETLKQLKELAWGIERNGGMWLRQNSRKNTYILYDYKF